jgi:hypothetical protein
MMRYLFCLLFCLSYYFGFGQDSLDIKMEWYKKAKSTPNLFVHFDKTIYSNNEIVYFTGYLLKLDSTAASKHHLLSVALIRDADSTVILQDKFLMQGGLAFGNITLLDKMLTGDYHFIAFTDRTINDIPEIMFTQAITIKTAIEPSFNASMKFLDEAKANDQQKKLLISVTSPEGRFLTKPITISYRYGDIKVTALADKSGQLLINLPLQSNLVNPNIYVKIKYERDSNFISTAVPQPTIKASVKFYPEGGNMVAGVGSTIGWEVLDQQKLPLRLKALLFKNNELIDTIETSIYGIGKFTLIPEANFTYKVKLMHSSLVDSAYILPKTQSSGVTITVSKAIVSDTLSIIMRSNSSHQLWIRVHNFQSCFVSVPFSMKLTTQKIKIPLTDVPKGLNTITITDTLDRPLAERIFFAHYSPNKQLDIITDKTIYKQREKINLKIKLTTPEDGIVSIACIQNSRLALRNLQDISSFTYLTNELNQLPAQLNGNPMADPKYLEEVLLVKGWRRYNWQDLMQASEKLNAFKEDSLTFNGRLTYPRKNVKINYIISFGSPRALFIPTDSIGNFHINLNQLVEKPGTRLFFLLNAPDRIKVDDNYIIKINDPYQIMNAKLAKQFNPEMPILPSTLQNNKELILKNNERSISLKEVVIGTKNDTVIGNQCGDYICPYNILNCINHVGFRGNTLPIVGHYYLKYSGLPGTVKYAGCFVPNESVFFQAKPIYLNKEFYRGDYSDPQEPAYFSTIYWNYGLVLNGKEETEVSFYSSDITGKFRIIIQGISNKDVIYGEHFFEVINNALSEKR